MKTQFGLKANKEVVIGALLGIICIIVAYFLLVPQPISKFADTTNPIYAVIKKDGNIWTTPNLSNPNWIQVPNTSGVKQLIQLSDSTYAVVKTNGSVWITPNLSNPDWTQVPKTSNVRQLIQLNDSTFAFVTDYTDSTFVIFNQYTGYAQPVLNARNDIFVSKTLSNPDWVKVPVPFNVSQLLQLQDDTFVFITPILPTSKRQFNRQIYEGGSIYISDTLSPQTTNYTKIKDVNGFTIQNPGNIAYITQLIDGTIVSYNTSANIVYISKDISIPDQSYIMNTDGVGQYVKLQDGTHVVVSTNAPNGIYKGIPKPDTGRLIGNWNQVPGILDALSILEFQPGLIKTPPPPPPPPPPPINPPRLAPTISFIKNGYITNVREFFATGPNVLSLENKDTLPQQITNILAENNITRAYNYVSIWNDGGFRIYNVPPDTPLTTNEDPYISTYSVSQGKPPPVMSFTKFGYIKNVKDFFSTGPNSISLKNIDTLPQQILEVVARNNITKPFNYVSIWNDGGFRIYNVPQDTVLITSNKEYNIYTYSFSQIKDTYLSFKKNGYITNVEQFFATGPNVLSLENKDTLPQQIANILSENNVTKPYNYVSIWNDGGFRIYDVPQDTPLTTNDDPYISTYLASQTPPDNVVPQTTPPPVNNLKVISFAGINKNGNILTTDSLSNPVWTTANGYLSYLIQLKDGTFAGVNSSGNIYTTANLSNTNLTQVNGNLSYLIQLNDGKFAGIGASNRIYIAADLSNPSWEETSLSFKYFIQLKDGTFAGLSGSGNIFINTRLSTQGMVRNTEAPYSLSYLTQLRDGRIVALNNSGDIYVTLTPGLSANTKWSQVTTNMRMSYLIELKDGTYLGINLDNKVYKTQSLLNANWIPANDNLSLKNIIEINTPDNSKFTNISRFGTDDGNIMTVLLLLLPISAFIVYLYRKRKIKI